MKASEAKIIPIILSGGEGSRLWPLSDRSHPKPFIEVSGKPLLSHALERAALISNEAIIVTNRNYLNLTEQLLNDTPNAPSVSYLLEPMPRNTAPAITLAVQYVIEKYGENAVCLVLAADHLIVDDLAFKAAVETAVKQAQSGNLVVFGIRPTGPETGYGYLEVKQKDFSPQKLLSFVEKPELYIAEKYFADGRYFWNSGMFCFVAGRMAVNIKEHATDVWEACSTAFQSRTAELGRVFFEESHFKVLPDVSIDYAVMEKASEIIMVPAEFRWSDVGSWDAVAGAHETDLDGNSVIGSQSVYAIDSSKIHVESTSNIKKVIAVIGIDNLVVIDTPDALLIANRSKSQQVKSLVKILKTTGEYGAFK